MKLILPRAELFGTVVVDYANIMVLHHAVAVSKFTACGDAKLKLWLYKSKALALQVAFLSWSVRTIMKPYSVPMYCTVHNGRYLEYDYEQPL